jgi:prephenate dehydratase
MSAQEKQRTVVAFQGELGAYSDEAAHEWFGEGVETLPKREFRDVAQAVTSGEAAYGVLPVENTLVGSVGPALDALLETELQIVGEVVRPIRHCLMALTGATAEGLQKVLSHPSRSARSSGSSRSARSSRRSRCTTPRAPRAWSRTAAIRRRRDRAEAAAKRYGLHVLARDLQDRPTTARASTS